MSLTSTIRKNGYGREWKHPHELEWKSYQKPFKCDGCKELGIGPRYCCDSCDYDLHKVCHEMQYEYEYSMIGHDHFPGDKFEFLLVPPATPSGRFCDASGKVVLGFVYHCKEKGWDLHPCCSNLETKIYVDGTDFVLGHLGQQGGVSNCMWCKNKTLKGTKKCVPGWSYVSSCGDCRLHVYCLSEMVWKAWKKGELIIQEESSTHHHDVEGSLVINKKKKKPALLANKKNGSRMAGHEFFKKAELFVMTLIGLLFGDPTALLANIFFQFLTN